MASMISNSWQWPGVMAYHQAYAAVMAWQHQWRNGINNRINVAVASDGERNGETSAGSNIWHQWRQREKWRDNVMALAA